MVPQARCHTGKRRFLHRSDAVLALDDLLAGSKDHPARAAKLTVYMGGQCCGGWHIGHNYGPIQKRTARRGKHRRQVIRES